MNKNISYIAWSLLLAAACSWVGVWYVGAVIRDKATAAGAAAASSEQLLDKAAYTKRIASLAVETKDQRTRLESLVGKDIVSIANEIEGAGKSARVEAHVNGALPKGSVQILPGNITLQEIVFVVQAQGSFASLMQLVALYEHLSLPSSIQQVELEHLKGLDAKSPSWRMTIHIRVMTTASTS